jgi:hypothetical protein
MRKDEERGKEGCRWIKEMMRRDDERMKRGEIG